MTPASFIPSALKVSSYNTYLISKRFNDHLETFPERRAPKIRDFMGQQDISFCQEVWGAGLPELTKDLADKFVFPPSRSPFRLFGSTYLGEMANTFYLHSLKTGGLFDVAASTIKCRYRKKHTFTKSRSKSLKGVEATLWDVSYFWGHSTNLLVFNAHLDPFVVENKRLQIKEMNDFVGETIESIDNLNDISDDTTTNADKQHDWTNTGVLIVGDFNIKADSEEYKETLMSNDGWIDLFQGETSQTYAERNSLAGFPEDYGRIDYIFSLERYGSSHTFLPLKVVSRCIRQEPVGEESSDHYALQVELLPSSLSSS